MTGYDLRCYAMTDGDHEFGYFSSPMHLSLVFCRLFHLICHHELTAISSSNREGLKCLNKDLATG